MTPSIIFLFALIVVMAYLFITEKLSVDLVALTGLLIITLAGYITPGQAFSGFSSPAIVTMISMFFVGGALRRTGVAGFVARVVCRQVGTSEPVVVAVVMLIGAVLSGGMNNVAATTVLLPAVITISEESKVSVSRLLMPLSFGVILGGMMTAIGTTPNIVMIDVMKEAGLEPFHFTDFTPYGLAVVVVGIIYTTFFGRKLLPNRKLGSRLQMGNRDLAKVYRLSERLFSLRVPTTSNLGGLTLEQSKFGSVFGARIVAVESGNNRKLHPDSDYIIKPNDVLIVQGRRSRLESLLKFRGVTVEAVGEASHSRMSEVPTCAVVALRDDEHLGKDLRSIHFRERYGLVVVGITRDDKVLFHKLGRETIQDRDKLHVVGTAEAIKALSEDGSFDVQQISFQDLLYDKFFIVRIPSDSPLLNETVKDTRLGELVGVHAAAIFRQGDSLFGLDGKEVLREGDSLLVVGDAEQVSKLGLLGVLEVESQQSAETLRSSDMILTELVLPPRSRAIGKDLVEISFRERFAFEVMAVWHEGRPYRSNLGYRKLQVGDALLVHGPRNKLPLLKSDPDFMILGGGLETPTDLFQSIAALSAFLIVTALSITGIYPVHIAAVVGAVLVLLCRSISIEDAYSEVSWKVVFLIAALLPFGLALEASGGADYLGTMMAASMGVLGFSFAVILLSLVTSIMSQMLDGAVAVLLVAPIAIDIANRLDGDPKTILMAVALASSIAFITPFSHKASLLVMGAGGYRVRDYARLGIPLTGLTFVVLWALLLFF